MIKRFCNRCGRIYTADNGQKCTCKASVKAEAERRARYDRNTRLDTGASFYHSPAWQRLAEAVRSRDRVDRLQYHLYCLHGFKLLRGYYPDAQLKPRTAENEEAVRYAMQYLQAALLDENGMPRFLGDDERDLHVHHILPRTEEPNQQWYMGNLIALSPQTHNTVHELYNKGTAVKHATIAILRDALTNGGGKYLSGFSTPYIGRDFSVDGV